MIYRLLVLLFAIVMIAAGTERMCAEVYSDSVADVLDEDVVIHQVATTPLPPPTAITQSVARPDRITPAPALSRVFRPPRTVLV